MGDEIFPPTSFPAAIGVHAWYDERHLLMPTSPSTLCSGQMLHASARRGTATANIAVTSCTRKLQAVRASAIRRGLSVGRSYSSLTPAHPRTALPPPLLTSTSSNAAVLRASRSSFHTSSTASFLPLFGLGNKQDTPEYYASQFLLHLSDRDAEQLNATYPKLRQSILKAQDEDPDFDAASLGLTPQDLTAALKLLAQTSFISADLKTLRTIYDDLETIWAQRGTEVVEVEDEGMPSTRQQNFNSYLTALINAERLGEAGKVLLTAIHGKALPVTTKNRSPATRKRSIHRTVPTTMPLEDIVQQVFAAAVSSGRVSSTDPLSRTTTIADWSVYLAAVASLPASRCPGYSSVKELVLVLRQNGLVDVTIWEVLLSSLFRDKRMGRQSVSEEVRTIRRYMQEDGTRPSQTFLTHLLRDCIASEDVHAGQEVIRESEQLGQRDIAYWNVLIKYAGKTEGPPGVLRTVEQMREAGVEPEDSTLALIALTAYMVAPSVGAVASSALADATQNDRVKRYSLQDFRARFAFAEKMTGLLPGHSAYASAFEKLATYDLQDLVTFYSEAQRDGVDVSSDILREIVYKCASLHLPLGMDPASSEASTEWTKRLAFVKAVYDDLVNNSRYAEERSKRGLYDYKMYAVLVQFCARPEIADLSWAIALLEDARHSGLSFPNGATTTANPSDMSHDRAMPFRTSQASLPADASAATLVTNLMRHAATNHSEAFKAYSWMWAIDTKEIFTYDDFVYILQTFAKLEFPRSYCPPSIFFAFFEDMRKAGMPPGHEAYEAALWYYNRQGRSKQNQDAVRQIHDVLKMDQFTDPDIGVMNNLMFAYCRTGNLEAAMGIWRTILINRMPYDNVTISVLYDTYGFMGTPTLAPQMAGLWKTLKAQRFPLNTKNLESYIEALGRMGRYQEVIDLAFAELDEGKIKLRRTTFEVLLKFLRGDPAGTYHDALKRLRARDPEMYDSVEYVASSAPSSARR